MTPALALWLPPVLALLVAAAVSGWLSRPGAPLRLLDHPNARSLHWRPTPRSGGLGVLAGLAAGLALGQGALPPPWPVTLLAVVLICAVSFWDDWAGVAPRWRLLVHGLAAALVVAVGPLPAGLALPGLGTLPLAGMEWLLWLLFMVWMVNLYNFMDGMDGLAGGMAVVGFASFAVLGWGHETFVAASLTVAGAAAGFLWFNLPPARIFLGDTGSTLLGLLVGLFSLWGVREGIFPLWIAVLVFSPFVVDASVTLLRRTLGGEKLWQSHRTHYYQRLVLAGWGHGRVLMAEYALMLACSISAWLALRMSSTAQTGLMAGWLLGYAILGYNVDRTSGGIKREVT